MEEEEAEEEEESVGRVDSAIEDEISLHSDVVIDHFVVVSDSLPTVDDITRDDDTVAVDVGIGVVIVFSVEDDDASEGENTNAVCCLLFPLSRAGRGSGVDD